MFLAKHILKYVGLSLSKMGNEESKPTDYGDEIEYAESGHGRSDGEERAQLGMNLENTEDEPLPEQVWKQEGSDHIEPVKKNKRKSKGNKKKKKGKRRSEEHSSGPADYMGEFEQESQQQLSNGVFNGHHEENGVGESPDISYHAIRVEEDEELPAAKPARRTRKNINYAQVEAVETFDIPNHDLHVKEGEELPAANYIQKTRQKVDVSQAQAIWEALQPRKKTQANPRKQKRILPESMMEPVEEVESEANFKVTIEPEDHIVVGSAFPAVNRSSPRPKTPSATGALIEIPASPKIILDASPVNHSPESPMISQSRPKEKKARKSKNSHISTEAQVLSFPATTENGNRWEVDDISMLESVAPEDDSLVVPASPMNEVMNIGEDVNMVNGYAHEDPHLASSKPPQCNASLTSEVIDVDGDVAMEDEFSGQGEGTEVEDTLAEEYRQMNMRRSERKLVREETPTVELVVEGDVPEDIAQLSQESVREDTPLAESETSAEQNLQSHISNYISLPIGEVSHQDAVVTESDVEAQIEEEPLLSSEKARGKRKATSQDYEEVVAPTKNKKRKSINGASARKPKQIKDNGPPNKNIAEMFANTSALSSRRNSADNNGLDKLTERLYPRVASPQVTDSPSAERRFRKIAHKVTSFDQVLLNNTEATPNPSEGNALMKAKKTSCKRRLVIDQASADVDAEPSNLSQKSANPKTPKVKSVRAKKTPKTKEPKTLKVKTPASSALRAPAATMGPKLSIGDRQTEILKSAVTGYQEYMSWSTEEVVAAVHGNTGAASELWRDVCDQLPNIPRRKVIDSTRRLFHNFERGGWTPEADEALRDAYEKFPKQWAEIARSLNRFSEDVRDRWRNYLICGDNKRTDVWDQHEELLLTKAVEECRASLRKNVRRSSSAHSDLEAADQNDHLLDWNIVSKKMSHVRSRIQCRAKWAQMKQRSGSDGENEFSQQPISTSWRIEDAEVELRGFSATEKLTLLTTIRSSGASREGKIPWSSIRHELKEKNKRMAWKLCFRLLKEKVEGYEDMKFREILDHLISVFEEAAPQEPKGFQFGKTKFAQRDPKPVGRASSSANKLKRKFQLSTFDSESENEESGFATSSKQSQKKKQKLHETMRRDDGTTTQNGDLEDTPAFNTPSFGRKTPIKYGKRTAKAPIMNPKVSRARASNTANFLSAERVVESSDEEAVVPAQKGSTRQLKPAHSQHHIQKNIESVALSVTDDNLEETDVFPENTNMTEFSPQSPGMTPAPELPNHADEIDSDAVEDSHNENVDVRVNTEAFESEDKIDSEAAVDIRRSSQQSGALIPEFIYAANGHPVSGESYDSSSDDEGEEDVEEDEGANSRSGSSGSPEL
ncbi:hypothetical protein BJ878DRAFT_510005 [Calycina marina]|uniref:Uncharacterized protein n=1 Tax=Calycina marina TaxID=1763456 RepID=A0A9P7Z145_9HELO|nr:hypothetical protein BJ878DRAFT_510005 [Calycina marina]